MAKGFLDFLEMIAKVFGLLATFLLGFEAVRATFQNDFESRIPSIAAIFILLIFLACIYFAYLWKPPVSQIHDRSAKRRISRIKSTTRAGAFLITLLLALDLGFWVFIQQSVLWRSVYLAGIASYDTPELTRECASEKGAIKIDYPEEWVCQIKEDPITQEILVLSPQAQNQKSGSESKLIIQVYVLPELKSLDQFFDEHVDFLKNKRFDIFNLVKAEKVTFLSRNAYQIEYLVKESGSSARYIEIFSLRDLTAYIATFIDTDSSFSRNSKIANEMIKSMDFLE